MTETLWDESYPPSIYGPPSPDIATATVGMPGAFLNSEGVASGSEPANLAALNLLGPLGNTDAWAAGTYVVLGDDSEAYWDGTAWVAGRAPAPPVLDDPPPCATHASPGEPGEWFPSEAPVPEDMSAANALALELGDPWPAGSYVTLGNGRAATWDGERFTRGTTP